MNFDLFVKLVILFMIFFTIWWFTRGMASNSFENICVLYTYISFQKGKKMVGIAFRNSWREGEWIMTLQRQL